MRPESRVLGTLGKGVTGMRLYAWLPPAGPGVAGSAPIAAARPPDHTGVPRPSLRSPSGPTGSAAVHAGAGPSSYTTHVRQAPLPVRRSGWGSEGRRGAPAGSGFRVGAGHGAPIETSLTRGGGMAAPGPSPGLRHKPLATSESSWPLASPPSREIFAFQKVTDLGAKPCAI